MRVSYDFMKGFLIWANRLQFQNRLKRFCRVWISECNGKWDEYIMPHYGICCIGFLRDGNFGGCPSVMCFNSPRGKTNLQCPTFGIANLYYYLYRAKRFVFSQSAVRGRYGLRTEISLFTFWWVFVRIAGITSRNYWHFHLLHRLPRVLVQNKISFRIMSHCCSFKSCQFFEISSVWDFLFHKKYRALIDLWFLHCRITVAWGRWGNTQQKVKLKKHTK